MKTIVTTIQRGAKVNKVLLKNLVAFAKEHDVSKIQAFVMDGRNKDDIEIDPIVFDSGIELIVPHKAGTALNSNLKVYDTMIKASQINPLTGFNKKLSRDHSYILPSPKIRYLSIPNTSKLPRFFATTGSLTNGNYKLHTAQGRKANLEHQFGFVFVDIKNGKRFDIHQVEALKNGKFNYLTEYYSGGKKLQQQPEALVLGDWHTGDTCPITRKRTIQMIHDLKPRKVVFHDLFNGHSINHHEEKNFISKARSVFSKRHILEKELKETLTEIQFFSKEFPNVQFLVAESNHDIFLTTYLGLHNWLRDGYNSIIASKLFAPIVENSKKASLEIALSIIGKVPKNFMFLIEEHTPKMYGNGMVVGTSTHLKLAYTKGAGSWMNAHGILYKSGKYALLTLV